MGGRVVVTSGILMSIVDSNGPPPTAVECRVAAGRCPHAQGAIPGAAGDQDPTSARERDADERGLAICTF